MAAKEKTLSRWTAWLAPILFLLAAVVAAGPASALTCGALETRAWEKTSAPLESRLVESPQLLNLHQQNESAGYDSALGSPLAAENAGPSAPADSEPKFERDAELDLGDLHHYIFTPSSGEMSYNIYIRSEVSGNQLIIRELHIQPVDMSDPNWDPFNKLGRDGMNELGNSITDSLAGPGVTEINIPERLERVTRKANGEYKAFGPRVFQLKR